MSRRGGWESRTEWAGLASDYARRVLVRQVSIGAVATIGVMLLAPWMLVLESQRLGALWGRVAVAGAVGIGLAALLSVQRLSESRAVLQALSLEPDRVEPAHVGMVADVPLALTWRFVAAFAFASTLMALPGIVSSAGDSSRAVALASLAFAVFSAAAVVHFVVVREATIRAIELGPLEAIASWLEHESMRTPPQLRIVRKMVLAIAVPVAVVSVGSLLVAQAHSRAAVERERAALALQVARVGLEPVGPARVIAGREDALAAAAAFGLSVRVEAGRHPHDEPDLVRILGGQFELCTSLEDSGDEHACVRYGAEMGSSDSSGAVLVAIVAVLLAALFGAALGGLLAADLLLASRQVAALSTDSVLHGAAEVGGAARFGLVADVGRSVEKLTARFREFAAAQQRALRAKASAQRMKQLLFASVSHDLKSPLNAILGFCELIRDESLSVEQQESLDMVSGRGRELLAMIETILDAARVEAGQLKLAPEAVSAREFVDRALSKAFDLKGDPAVEVTIELAQDMPSLRADRDRGSGALAVLVAHAMSEAAEGKRGVVRIRATGPAEPGGMPSIHIEHASPRTRPSQLEEQLTGRSPTKAARGAALRLSLARAIVELHGGRVEVGRGPRGEAVLTCFWPAARSV